MRRGLLVVLLALAAAPAAQACGVAVSQASGPAPLTVTYTALCDSAAYTWAFGDGTAAEGKVVAHTIAAGRWGGSLTTDTGAEQVPVVTAVALTLAAPARGTYGDPVTLSGTVAPASRVRLYRGSAYVTTKAAGTDGRFRTTIRLLGPGPYTARVAGVVSAPVSIRVRPLLETRVVGARTVGRPLAVVATLRPAGAGSLQVRAGSRRASGRSVRLSLDTSRPARQRVLVRSVPGEGYEPAAASLDVDVAYPDLGYGDTGPSVRTLQAGLARLGYAQLGADGSYGQDTLDAVTAFQKVERLPRTGRADAALWARLASARTPEPRYGGGDHVEVDKTRQVLFLVRGGRVAQIVPVSTAGIPGYFTPEGRFAVYRKVAGLDPSPLGVLYDPSYFTGGYAIHGSPSVPPYPASHGCVRVPMWISWRLHTILGYGEPVVVYS